MPKVNRKYYKWHYKTINGNTLPKIKCIQLHINLKLNIIMETIENRIEYKYDAEELHLEMKEFISEINQFIKSNLISNSEAK